MKNLVQDWIGSVVVRDVQRAAAELESCTDFEASGYPHEIFKLCTLTQAIIMGSTGS